MQRKRCYRRATDGVAFEFRILGPLEVVAGGRPVALGGAKACSLLAFLLLHRGEVVSRERLVDEVWGEQPPQTVVAELRVYVAKLRKALRPDLIVTRRDGYVLLVDADRVDADAFERATRRGMALLAAGDAATAALVLAEALAMWRGPVLADLADEPWAQVEARRLDELRLVAQQERLEADLALGRHVGVVGELERLVVEHPYQERPRAQLMLALYRCGRQAEALELYRQTARVFADELGIQPGPELRQRERAILNHDPALRVRVLAEGNLPAPPTPLIGRRRELEELAPVLGQQEARLVTLTGAGGTGKTRLALEVAARLERELRIPAFLVELASLTDPSLVLSAIAQAVGVEKMGGGRVAEALCSFLRHRPLLVVLDNFEHLIEAACDVAALLARAPSLTILATSRRPLHIRAERCYDVDTLLIEDALTLFVSRVQAVQREFEPTAAVEDVCRQICERVDRLPLAIELAAAGMRRADPSLVLSRLDCLPSLGGGFHDAPERQQTLWATIEWSYGLLDDEQRRLFTRLSIFRGSFSFDAARCVCDAEPDVLAALVTASVIATRGDRFFMLETIREFAEANREAGDRDAIPRRHAEFYASITRQVGEELMGSSPAATLERVELDLGNFRLALEWWLGAESPKELLMFVIALYRFFAVSGRAAEGSTWISRALERTASVAALAPLRVVALVRAARLNDQAGDAPGARALYEHALMLARKDGDRAGESAALTGLARVAPASDSQVISMQEQAVEIARDVRDERELAIGLHSLARLHLVQGDLEAAAADLTSEIEILRKLGDVINECVSLQQLANVALHRGDTDDALASFRETIVTGNRLRSPWLSGAGVEGLAAALLARGRDAADVVRLLGASEALFAASGLGERYGDGYFATVSRGDVAAKLKAIVDAQAREALDSATHDRSWAEGRALAPEAAVEFALTACKLQARGVSVPLGRRAPQRG
jgi:DNA-binding SARP family transcriptional activator/predicted ATPase